MNMIAFLRPRGSRVAADILGNPSIAAKLSAAGRVLGMVRPTAAATRKVTVMRNGVRVPLVVENSADPRALARAIRAKLGKPAKSRNATGKARNPASTARRGRMAAKLDQVERDLDRGRAVRLVQAETDVARDRQAGRIARRGR
jgi:hypothetical protein